MDICWLLLKIKEWQDKKNQAIKDSLVPHISHHERLRGFFEIVCEACGVDEYREYCSAVSKAGSDSGALYIEIPSCQVIRTLFSIKDGEVSGGDSFTIGDDEYTSFEEAAVAALGTIGYNPIRIGGGMCGHKRIDRNQ